MSAIRVVQFVPDKKSPVGAWEVTCAECPMIPHLVALEMPVKPCLSGIITNVQGPVPIGVCKHYAKDSIASDGKGKSKKLTLTCNHP